MENKDLIKIENSEYKVKDENGNDVEFGSYIPKKALKDIMEENKKGQKHNKLKSIKIC